VDYLRNENYRRRHFLSREVGVASGTCNKWYIQQVLRLVFCGRYEFVAISSWCFKFVIYWKSYMTNGKANGLVTNLKGHL